ncbi:class I adenylate-forming enzyme family protein [Tenacibaculum xiamenense]|uniref:class I adenylate-forming enzyme family protein n=1 Tax=Tenacibaculum xiamenense TaxID=1261553 RepID=UPI0038948CC6
MSIILKRIFKKLEFDLTPKINNLFFYNEIDISSKNAKRIEQNILTTTLNSLNLYENFLKQKKRRPNYDLYACFQPFNESLKALYPFLKEIKKNIRKDDVILNLWDRSGWLTNLLCGFFPDQKIITTWEGNKDVLGYKGYHYWMSKNENLDILFCNLNKPLPLNTNSISHVIGLDVLHRFDQLLLLKELNRITNDQGCIIFPHVHLSNSQPTPFFERGGKQIHGNDYVEAFDYLLPSAYRKCFVLSEPKLFEENDIKRNESIELKSTPNTNDYNALIALLPHDWNKKELSYFSMKNLDDVKNSRTIINSLLNISLHQSKVSIDYNYFNGAMKSFLERHPIYEQRIYNLNNYTLSELAIKIIYLSQRGLKVQDIINFTNEQETNILHELNSLEKLGLLQVLPISETAIRLQNYFMTQEFISPQSEQTVKDLWANAVSAYANNIAIISLEENSEFTYDDCNEIVKQIISKFLESGLKKGDKIIISDASLHVESMLLFWACMQLGVIPVLLSENLNDENLARIQKLTEAKWFFTNESYFIKRKSFLSCLNIVLFDSDEENTEYDYFADWINSVDAHQVNTPKISQYDTAVILFTSGSTGIPKGVELTHGNLFRSGRLITETFHWVEDDRFFAMGSLDTMSGLRNSVISGLHVGSSVVLPKKRNSHNILSITEDIDISKSTILASNPAFLRQAVNYKSRILNQLNSVKVFMCTGNNLSTQLRKDFKTSYDKSIYNYYGLSETTGICIAQNLNDKNLDINTIGKPTQCIAQIVDENNNLLPFGEKGELRIYSDNLMKGYFKNPEATKKAIKNGWFYTQDLARMHKDGNIELLGRKRNIIKTSSEELIDLNIIQNFLMEVDFIQDVYVCPYYEDDFEKASIFLSLKSTFIIESPEKKIKDILALKFGLKQIPTNIIILPNLPFNENGKINKELLLNGFS